MREQPNQPADAILEQRRSELAAIGGMPEHLVAERPHEVRADLVCILCARTLGRVQGPNFRELKPVSRDVEDPDHARAVLRRRCPHCAGRLWLQNAEEVPRELPRIDWVASAPRRGRPPKMPSLARHWTGQPAAAT